MIIADKIGALLDRRSVLLVFCALPFALLLIVDLTGRQRLADADRGIAP